MKIGTPYSRTATKVMLLGSGELGKEVAIELNSTRLLKFMHVILPSCSSYASGAKFPHVFDMLDEDG